MSRVTASVVVGDGLPSLLVGGPFSSVDVGVMAVFIDRVTASGLASDKVIVVNPRPTFLGNRLAQLGASFSTVQHGHTTTLSA